MGIADGTERAEAPTELFDTLAPSIRVAIANKNLSPQQINRAVDELVDLIHNTEISFDEFREIVDSMKVNVYDTQRILDKKNYRFLLTLLRNRFCNSMTLMVFVLTVLMNQAAGEVQDIAKGIAMSLIV